MLEKYNFLSACIFCCRPYAGVVCDFCSKSFHVRDLHEGAMCELCGIRLTSEQRLCVPCRELATEERGTGCSKIASLWTYNIYTLKLIQSYKRDSNKLLGFYLAKQYYKFLLQVLEKNYINKEDVLIITMPANPQHVRKTGFDHMKYIGVYIALMDCCLPMLPAIARKKSKEQKTLNAEQRKINMEGTLLFKKRMVSKIIHKYSQNPHMHIVLLDDVVTTGATIHTAYQLIRKEIPSIPAPQIFAVSLVRNEY